MRRFARQLTRISQSRAFAHWITQVEAAFASGSLLAGSLRLGIVAAGALAQWVRQARTAPAPQGRAT